MVADPALPLWRGRTLAFVGILLVALNVRTAVAAVSPIARDIARDIPLDDVSLGALGMIPPAAFALAGLVTARIAGKMGAERFLLAAIAVMTSGHLVRAAGDSYLWMVIGSVLALLGMGVGNILLPALVKRYFPDRIGLMTGLYITMITFSAAIPAYLAVPLSELADWRWSIGSWAVLAAAGFAPWAYLLTAPSRRHLAAEQRPDSRLGGVRRLPTRWRLWTSRLAMTLAITAAVSSFSFFAIFAWLPEILIETAGQTAQQAGTLLALYSIVGCPASLVVPILAVRARNPGMIVQVGALASILGFVGLMSSNHATWLWVLLLSGGQAMFPVCLVLINLRSRTPEGSVVLSSFSQGFGFGVATAGPLVMGILRDMTGGWTAVFILMIVVSVPALITGTMLNRRAFIEDESAIR